MSPWLIPARLRRKTPPLGSRSTSKAWITYKAAHGGELLNVFNTTKHPVAANITVKGKPFFLVDVGKYQPLYSTKPGDVFFRTLTRAEATEVAETRLKAQERGSQFKLKPREQRRADVLRELSDVLIVDQVPPKG